MTNEDEAAGHLQRELKKRLPFDSPGQEAMLNLARTHDQIQIRFSRLFREHGLTSSQYNVLRILRGEGKPLPILEIAGRMIVVVPGITGLIDRLEATKLVARIRCEEDRRVVYVSITEEGLKVLDRVEQPLDDLHNRLLGHMAPRELRDLIRLLEKARRPLSEEPG